MEVVELGLDREKYCTEANFSLIKETDEFMLIGVNGLMSIIIALKRWLEMSEFLCSRNFKLFLVGLINPFRAVVECFFSIGNITRLIEHDADRMC